MTQTIKARYHSGLLQPLEPLELEEGSEVLITVNASEAGGRPGGGRLKTVMIEPGGAIDLPPEALRESGLRPGSAVVVLAQQGRIVLLDQERWRERAGKPMEELLAQFRDFLARNPQAPFFGGLSAEEYGTLTDEAEEELWARLTAEAEKQVKSAEREIPPHFRPSGQKRR